MDTKWLQRIGLAKAEEKYTATLPLTVGGAPHPDASSTCTVMSQQCPELPRPLRLAATKMMPVDSSIPNRPAQSSVVMLHTS